MFGKKRKGYADFKRDRIKEDKKRRGKRRGFANVIAGFILLMVALIILVKAVIPTVATAVSEGNFTGTEGVIMGLYTLLLAVVGLIMILAYFRTK